VGSNLPGNGEAAFSPDGERQILSTTIAILDVDCIVCILAASETAEEVHASEIADNQGSFHHLV